MPKSMVYIVKKRVGRYEYLYLQKSKHIRGEGQKKKTIHVAYLGRADKYTQTEISNLIKGLNRDERCKKVFHQRHCGIKGGRKK